MQDIFAFVQAKSPLSLTPTTNDVAKTQSGDDSFSESFFSIILGQLTNDDEKVSLNLVAQDTSGLVKEEASATTDLTLNDEGKSIDEHLLEDLLSVVNTLKNDSQTTTFPTLKASSNLEKILASESARQDFANVNSVSDLLDLSKKYNLGLEKISISKETVESLQTKFPTLTQNNFFNDLQTALENSQTTSTPQETTTQATTQTNLMSLLTKQTPKTENTTTTSILSELISKDTSLPSEPKLVQPTTPVKPDETLDTTLTLESETPIVNEKQHDTAIKVAQTVEEETTPTTAKPLETIVQKVANSNETKKIETPVQATTADAQEETVPVVTTNSARTNEVRTESSITEDIPETIIKPAKSEKTTGETASDEDLMLTQKVSTREHDEREVSESSSDEEQNTLDVKNDLKSTAKQDITTNKQTNTTKDSLNQFATDLKEKIEAYKPPIMKVELALSPKNLGDVDVTLLTRGNNLHVNISSNSTTMNLFTQNQAEVKNALVSMGFTNLEMNFSDQSNKEHSQQNNQKHSSGNFEEFTTDSTEEDTTLMEIVIPQYV